MSRARYRVYQFVTSLWRRVTPDERANLALWLPAEAVNLFRQMPQRDQRHSLDVFYALRTAGVDHPDLLAAALLHDVGKTVPTTEQKGQPVTGRRLRLWHRVLIVLLSATTWGSRWLFRLADDHPPSWRYPFFLHLHHPELSAHLAAQAGCSELTIHLIRRHQSKPEAAPVAVEERLLAALQAADDVN